MLINVARHIYSVAMDAPEPSFRNTFNERYDPLIRRIVRELSIDARASTNKLASAAASYRRKVSQKLEEAEQKLGLRYTIELNEQKLGLINSHLILAKFESKPQLSSLVSLLSSSHVPQVAATIKGNYDLIIYANAETSGEYVHWDKTTQMRLSEYGVLWEPSDVAHMQLGFVPLRNELISTLQLQEEYKRMLMLLNENSRMSFSEMGKRLGVHFNTVAYRFNKLLNSGYIRRFTITMDKIPKTSTMAVAGKYSIKDGFENDAANERKAIMADDTLPLANRYMLANQLVGSYDFFFVGTFDSREIAVRHGAGYFKRSMGRHLVRSRYGEIDKVILGRLPIRSIDTKSEYRTIKWTLEQHP